MLGHKKDIGRQGSQRHARFIPSLAIANQTLQSNDHQRFGPTGGGGGQSLDRGGGVRPGTFDLSPAAQGKNEDDLGKHRLRSSSWEGGGKLRFIYASNCSKIEEFFFGKKNKNSSIFLIYKYIQNTI